MRNPLSSRIVEIPFSGIRKFFDIAAEMKDVISLGVGEPDFDTPWHIRDEGIYSLEQGHTAYTSNAGLKDKRMTPTPSGLRFTTKGRSLWAWNAKTAAASWN